MIETKYDSKADTLEHIKRVNEILLDFIYDITTRAQNHDDSKLYPPEKELFDKYTPLLKDTTYGSEKYKQFLADLKPALDHHYKMNSHHPEHYSRGINGMCLLDVLEMLADWKAAGERHVDGNIFDSLKKNKERFGISDQLYDILWNTAKFFWEQG